jgi:CubicO group peptidase (beta-lactamase class C family)
MHTRRLLPLLLIGLLLPVVVAAQDAGNAALAADLETYIAKGMSDWKIPGLSIAVVRNDAVIYAKGFGVRRPKAEAAKDSLK